MTGTGWWKKSFRAHGSFVGFCGARWVRTCDGDRVAQKISSGPRKFCGFLWGQAGSNGDRVAERILPGARKFCGLLWD